jgi:hypothetical protein
MTNETTEVLNAEIPEFGETERAMLDMATKHLVDAINQKNTAQKFDRPDSWTGVAIKYATTGVAAWATFKGCDYLLEQSKKKLAE